MNDSLFMGGRESMSHLERVVDYFSLRQRPASHSLAEALPFEILRNQVVSFTLGADVVNGKQVRMAETTQNARLTLEALQAVGVVCK